MDWRDGQHADNSPRSRVGLDQHSSRQNKRGPPTGPYSATDPPAFRTHLIDVTVELTFSASASGVMSVIWLMLRLRGERNAHGNNARVGG